jgi:predicted dinucleotide-binding enzyme
MSSISIIGSGDMAAAIGGLAVKAGHAVEVIARDAGRAGRLSDKLGEKATTGRFGGIPAGAIVILAVPYSAAVGVVKEHRVGLAGKILVDITNPIKPDFSGFLTPDGSFGAREIAKVVPAGVKIVKAFNTQNAGVLASAPAQGRSLDVFVAGDDAHSKAKVATFIESLELRSMDAGPLAMAWTLEHGCMLWLGLMTSSVRHANFSIGVSILD